MSECQDVHGFQPKPPSCAAQPGKKSFDELSRVALKNDKGR